MKEFLKRAALTCFLTLGAALLFVLIAAGSADSHHTNARYLGWKLGIFPYEPTRCPRYLKLDASFLQSFRGKGKATLARWFPDLRAAEEANRYQRFYNDKVGSPDFLWIGDSAWAVVFERGRIVEFRLMKG